MTINTKEMDIKDFLPSYPNVNKSKEELLNPYEDDFYSAIYKKKEFYEEKLPLIEDLPSEHGMLMKHQNIIARFLSSHTMYDSLLLAHEMGTGKTCSAIGAIEQIKNENSTIDGAYIFAGGRNLLNNFVRELRDKCTAGQYIPDNFNKLSAKEQFARTRKLYEDFYHFRFGDNKPTTFETFAKYIRTLHDDDIVYNFSNKIIVIDEVHNLREKEDVGDKINIYKEFHRFLHIVKNCKILLLSGTPMKSYFYIYKYDFVLKYILNVKKLTFKNTFNNKRMLKVSCYETEFTNSIYKGKLNITKKGEIRLSEVRDEHETKISYTLSRNGYLCNELKINSNYSTDQRVKINISFNDYEFSGTTITLKPDIINTIHMKDLFNPLYWDFSYINLTTTPYCDIRVTLDVFDTNNIPTVTQPILLIDSDTINNLKIQKIGVAFSVTENYTYSLYNNFVGVY